MKLRHLFTLFVGVLLVFSFEAGVNAQSTIYFVSPDGLDTNTGTSSDSPWTLGKALQTAPAGSTINFLTGTYRTEEYLRRTMTLQPYADAQVVLKGSIIVPDGEWTIDGDDWVRNGWMAEFPPPAWEDPANYVDPAYPMANHRDMVFVSDQALIQVATRAEVIVGTFFVDYATDQLFIGTNPIGQTVEATAFNRGIGIFGADKSNSVIRGLTFMHYPEMGIHVGESDGTKATNIVIEDNTFLWNGVAGINVGGADSIIRGNTMSYNGRKGMGGSGDRMLIENNIVTYNNVEHFRTGWDAAGIKVIRGDGIIFRNNLFANNESTGLWMDIGSDNITVTGNIARSNKSIGFFFEISKNAIIAGNLSVNNGAGIQISNSSNAKIYNNTVTGNKTNLRITESDRQAEEWETESTFATENIVVMNNLFSNAEGANDPNAMIDTWMHNHAQCAADAPMISAFDHNGYYRTDPLLPENIIRWVQKTPQCYNIYPSVEAFKTDSGFEMHGLEFSGTTQPFFIDEAAGNYQLKSDSAAIGAGAPLPADVAAALGWASDSPVDLGAYQYNGLLVNGSFEHKSTLDKKVPAGWKAKGFGLDKVKCNKLNRPGKPDKTFSHDGACAFRFTGAPGKTTKLTQALSPYGLETGDSLVLDAHVSGKAAVEGGLLIIKSKYDTGLKNKIQVIAPPGTYAYQPVTGTLALQGRVVKLKVQIRYSGASGILSVDMGRVTAQGNNTRTLQNTAPPFDIPPVEQAIIPLPPVQ